MSEYPWISCSSGDLRLELSGEVLPGENGDADVLTSVDGIRVRNVAASADDQELVYIDLVEIPLDEPLVLVSGNGSGTTLQVSNLSGERVVLEGVEGIEGRFFGLLSVSGWKLILERDAGGSITTGLYLLSDWEFDTHPDYFPGSTLGETSLEGILGSDQDLDVSIPWPLSVAGRLALQSPQQSGERWTAGIVSAQLPNLFDGAGMVLKDFPLRRLPGLKEDEISNLDVGLNDEGDIQFVVTIPLNASDVPTPQVGGPTLQVGGQALSLSKTTTLNLQATLGSTHLTLEAWLPSLSDTSLDFNTPLATPLADGQQAVRELVVLFPNESNSAAPTLPDINLSFSPPPPNGGEDAVVDKKMSYVIGKAQMPLRWDSVPLVEKASTTLADWRLASLNASPLEGFRVNGQSKHFRFGIIEGPTVRLEITSVKEVLDGWHGLELGVALHMTGTTLDFDVTGKWRFYLDMDTLSFKPGRTIKLDTDKLDTDGIPLDFSGPGLRVEGLQSLAVTWENNQLNLQASDLKAYFYKVNDPADSSLGFEFDVSHFGISAKGLDLEMTLTGGAPILNGIGETFKGVRGAISIAGSQFQSGSITAEGPLPHLDNATGSITLLFNRDFELDQVKSEFQLGLHRRAAWWLELDLQSVRIDIDTSGATPTLILMISGGVSFAPPKRQVEDVTIEAPNLDSLLDFFESARLDFKDLVLTRAFDRIPPGIPLTSILNKPEKVNLLEVFEFEMRSIGLESGSDPGEAALVLGGQIFFSSKDLLDVKVDFHKFKIERPSPGDILPRVSLRRLGVRFNYKETVEVEGFVSFFEDPDRKGFKGGGTLIIGKWIGVSVLLEFTNVLRPEDQKWLRVWMVYIDWRNANIPLIAGLYLRDIGLGFGWRKTLKVMDNPMALISDPSKSSEQTMAHRPEAWEDFLIGDEPYWTLVMSAWLTMGNDSRGTVTPLVGDMLLGIRNDLTFLIGMRGWLLTSLDDVKGSGQASRPAIHGVIYFSVRRRHMLASFGVNPANIIPQGVPPMLAKAIAGPPFNITLETAPSLFRLELGFPRQLTLRMGIWQGRAGVMFRRGPQGLAIGFGFEIGLGFEYDVEFDFGIIGFSIFVGAYIGVFGQIQLQIGVPSALLGTVGVNAFFILRLSIWVDLFFFSLSFSITFELTLSARLTFAIAGGFGFEGYARASLKVWKFKKSVALSLAVNKGVIRRAERIFGSSFGGDAVAKKTRPLPQGTQAIPPLPEEPERRWRTVHIQKGEFVYVLLLPEQESWFASPHGPPEGVTQEEFEWTSWQSQDVPDYEFEYELQHATYLEHLADPIPESYEADAVNGRLSFRLNWDARVRNDNVEGTKPPPDTDKFQEESALGDWFYQPGVVQAELQKIDAILERYQPTLLWDWRVRAERGAAGHDGSAGIRPDVRSPYFSSDDAMLYDEALEEAFGYGEEDTISWHRIALGLTLWDEAHGWSETVQDFIGTSAFKQYTDSAYRGASSGEPIGDPRERLFTMAEKISDDRSTLVARLLLEFRHWVRTDSDENDHSLPGALLAKAGVAFKFQVEQDQDWRIAFTRIQVNRGEREEDDLGAEDITGNTIQKDGGGLGFASGNGHTYRIKDILEFQDQDGIHFSWLLECTHATAEGSESHVMTLEELSGLDSTKGCFEFFDHWKVQRINLSAQGTSQDSVITRQVRPAFVPSYFDMGGGVYRFYLVVPRFDFTDGFSSSAEGSDGTPSSDEVQATPEVGDLLRYRIAAVDVFGQESQTTEWLTTRKQLNPPPPPEGGQVAYEIDLEQIGDSEKLILTVTPSREMATWTGGAVRYEVWAQSLPIESGGFFGLGDDGGETVGLGDGEPVIEPKGMTLVSTLRDGQDRDTLDHLDLDVLGYGHVHRFYVRAVSQVGNASRLVLCTHEMKIAGMKEPAPTEPQEAQDQPAEKPPQLSIERIPPPGEAAVWVPIEEMRAEFRTALEPRPLLRPDGTSTKDPPPLLIASERVEVDDATEREVSLRLMHLQHVDPAAHHPTGGYEVFVRDRDATIDDVPANYQPLAEAQVVSPEHYRNTPPRTVSWSRWHGRYLLPEESAAFLATDADGGGQELACLDWCDECSDDYSHGGHLTANLPLRENPSGDSVDNETMRIETLPGGASVHFQLWELLYRLQEAGRAQDWKLTVLDGGITGEERGQCSFDKLLEDHAEEKDPDGIGLLKRLGRSVDFALDDGSEPVDPQTVYELLADVYFSGSTSVDADAYLLVLDILFNGDRRSQMGYYRLSLLPRICELQRLHCPDDPPLKPSAEAERQAERQKTRDGQRTHAFESFKKVLLTVREDQSVLAGALESGGQEAYENLTRRFLRQRPISDAKLRHGVAFYEDSGSFSRPLNADGTISLQLYYKEPYARRYAYRVRRISRYLLLYRSLGLLEDAALPPFEDDDRLLVRLPRVTPPAPPVIRFLGNADRAGVLTAEWAIDEHDEQAMVQSNETLRNRLGYRGVAWSLFSQAIADWERWSGWKAIEPDGPTWFSLPEQPGDGGVRGLSAAEWAVMERDAAWPEPSPSLPPEAGLEGHPFTGPLLPKGSIVRVPALPYYYRYQLGAFARTDDVDSEVKLVEASQVLPSLIPKIKKAYAGWNLNDDGKLDVWWLIPPVWDSLSEVERAAWINEKPYATRLWDFDLRYWLSIELGGMLETVLDVRPIPPEEGKERERAVFSVQTFGRHLLHDWTHTHQIELSEFTLSWPFRPEVFLTLDVSDSFASQLDANFVFKLRCARPYSAGQGEAASIRRGTRVADLSRLPDG